MSKNIYQFKITLKEIKPPIWRRLQVPEDYSLYDLHVAIQDSFPWSDYHLNQFSTVTVKESERKYYGFPDPDNDWQKITLEWEAKIKDIFQIDGNKSLNYDYDFGDGWEHRIDLEEILPVGKGIKYPRCLDGRRACPPEDCGGYPGYDNLLKVLKNPQDEEYQEICDWLGIEKGDNYDFEYFDPQQIEFRNPITELKKVKAGFGVK